MVDRRYVEGEVGVSSRLDLAGDQLRLLARRSG